VSVRVLYIASKFYRIRNFCRHSNAMRPFDVRPTVNLIGPNGQTTALMPDLRGTPKPPFTNTKPPAKRRDLLKATPAGSDRHPKWCFTLIHCILIARTRRNREGTIFGNNRVGRRGKPACEACRKRKSKVLSTISTVN